MTESEKIAFQNKYLGKPKKPDFRLKILEFRYNLAFEGGSLLPKAPTNPIILPSKNEVPKIKVEKNGYAEARRAEINSRIEYRMAALTQKSPTNSGDKSNSLLRRVFKGMGF